MPDGSNPTPPPDGGSGQVGEPAGYSEIPFAAGQDLLLAVRGDTQVFLSRTADGTDWLVSINPVTGDYSATRVEYTTPIVPTVADGFADGFSPVANQPTVVWDPNIGTLSTVAAGTVFTAPVSGYSDGTWNIVSLPLNPGFSADIARNVTLAPGLTVSLNRQQPVGPPPSVEPGNPTPPAPTPPAPTPTGGVTITIVRPDGTTVTIVVPPGSTVVIGPNGNPTVTLPPPTPPQAPTLPKPDLPPLLPVPRRPELAPMPRPRSWLDGPPIPPN